LVEDSALITKCLEGNAEAYGRLVDKYSARIINLGYAMIGDRHQAEDIAQDAFVRAFKGLPRFSASPSSRAGSTRSPSTSARTTSRPNPATPAQRTTTSWPP